MPAVALRCTSSAAFLDCIPHFLRQRSDSVVIGHNIHFCYLLTYLNRFEYMSPLLTMPVPTTVWPCNNQRKHGREWANTNTGQVH